MEQGHRGHPALVRSRVSRVNMDIQDPIVRPSKQQNVAVQTVVVLVHMLQLLMVLAIVLSPWEEEFANIRTLEVVLPLATLSPQL